MNKLYELTVLLSGESTADEIKVASTAVGKLITAHKGKIEKEESWGKKYMAYAIKKQKEAYYLFWEVNLPASEAQGLERDVRLMDTVIRSLFVIKED